MSSTNNTKCRDCGHRVTWIVLGINIVLLIVKVNVALYSGSRALMADALQSLAALIVSGIVLASLKVASRDADEAYPYGYGKMEFITSGIVNFFLFLGALAFIGVAIKEMTAPGPEQIPELLAIGAGLVSMLGNHIAYKYGQCAGRQLGSSAILANAKVNLADFWSSTAVIVAVVGANLGWPSLDHIVALIIGLIIIRVSLMELEKAVILLMDFSPGTAKIKKIASRVPGVREVQNIKTRLVGRKMWVDLEIGVLGSLEMEDALQITRKLKLSLAENLTTIEEVSVRLRPIQEQG